MSSQAGIQADSNSSPEASEYKLTEGISTAREASDIHNDELHYVRRGQEVADYPLSLSLSTGSIEG
jgi:hypothetical protein